MLKTYFIMRSTTLKAGDTLLFEMIEYTLFISVEKYASHLFYRTDLVIIYYKQRDID